jgi:hypothetical protein
LDFLETEKLRAGSQLQRAHNFCYLPLGACFFTEFTMAKARVKKRTHLRAQNASAAAAGKGTASSMTKAPKSMVIRVGASQVGTSVSQLVQDVRQMMEPDTAVRLKVWRQLPLVLGSYLMKI